MYELTEIERLAEQSIVRCYGESEGKALWGGYSNARENALKDILPFISQEEKELTDHGPRHIINVLENAVKLLGQDACIGTDSKTALNANEMYFLVLAILLHDAGNIFGRVNHNTKLEEAYEHCRGAGVDLARERRLLYPIIKAHCGKTASGSKDTIGVLSKSNSFKSHMLDSQRVASILRFADELAEGPQRTSAFMKEHFPPVDESRPYHDYAEVTEITIDRNNSRIVVTYDIDIFFSGSEIDEERLKELLDLCEVRAIKLDLERKYARHYCSLLRPFKQTEISFHFNCNGTPLETNILRIVLDDLVLPEPKKEEKLSDKNAELSYENLISTLKESLKQCV